MIAQWNQLTAIVKVLCRENLLQVYDIWVFYLFPLVNDRHAFGRLNLDTYNNNITHKSNIPQFE